MTVDPIVIPIAFAVLLAIGGLILSAIDSRQQRKRNSGKSQ